MRKYRGKRVDTGEWVYGYLIGNDVIVGEIVEITEEYFCTEWWWRVDPNTVGQSTGLKVKDGKEIYEGDIVKGYWWDKGTQHRHIGTVTYVMNAFVARGVKQYKGLDKELNPIYEVIGNIHDNPELAEVGT